MTSTYIPTKQLSWRRMKSAPSVNYVRKHHISRLPEVYRKPRLLEKRRITERKNKNTRLRMHGVSPSTCQAAAFTLRFAPALSWRADLSNTVVGQGFFLAKFHVVRKDAADLSTTVYAVSVGGLKTRVLILERRQVVYALPGK